MSAPSDGLGAPELFVSLVDAMAPVIVGVLMAAIALWVWSKINARNTRRDRLERSRSDEDFRQTCLAMAEAQRKKSSEAEARGDLAAAKRFAESAQYQERLAKRK